MFNLNRACEIQVMALTAPGGVLPVKPEILEQVSRMTAAVLKGMGAELAWPAVLRSLDRVDPSYRN
jgi:hypothetical protein